LVEAGNIGSADVGRKWMGPQRIDKKYRVIANKYGKLEKKKIELEQCLGVGCCLYHRAASGEGKG